METMTELHKRLDRIASAKREELEALYLGGGADDVISDTAAYLLIVSELVCKHNDIALATGVYKVMEQINKEFQRIRSTAIDYLSKARRPTPEGLTSMPNHDIKGRPYAKLSKLRPGQLIELNNGFTCTKARTCTIHLDKDNRLFFSCDDGLHYLDGQADDGEHCIGVYAHAQI